MKYVPDDACDLHFIADDRMWNYRIDAYVKYIAVVLPPEDACVQTCMHIRLHAVLPQESTPSTITYCGA